MKNEFGSYDVASFIDALPAPPASEQSSSASASANPIVGKEAYHAAQRTKLNWWWNPDAVSGDLAVRESFDLLTARVRDIVRNDPILLKCKRVLQRLVIGTGIRVYSAASELDEAGSGVEAFENESDVWFERWAMEEADAMGESPLAELQRVAFGDEVEAGNCLWLRVIDNDPDRIVPLSYQLIEWEQLDRSKDRDAELSRSGKGRRFNRITNGIEYDSRNRKSHYHLYDVHPFNGTGFNDQSTRISADRIIHQFWPERPSSRMNASWFAPMVNINRDLDRFLVNELTTRALQAKMAYHFKSPDAGFDPGMDTLDQDGVPYRMYKGVGGAFRTGPDDSVEIVESKRSTSENLPLQMLMLNLHSMGCGISLNRLLGDPSKANLASLKAAHADDAGMMAPIQVTFATKVLRQIRKEFHRFAFAKGLFRTVSADDFRRRPWFYNEFLSIAPNAVASDKDDVQAAIDRLRSGQSTFPVEAMRMGIHPRKLIRQVSRYNDIFEREGVVFDWGKGGGQAASRTSTVRASDEELEATDGQ